MSSGDRRSTHRVVAAIVLATLSPLGCARALREPPSLADLGGGGSSPRPERVAPLLLKAGVLYALRNPADVREAGVVWLEAARADATRIEGLIGAARAYVWLVDHEPEAAAREKDATLAVQAAQWCERIRADSPECVYWLGAALGVQARERRSTALDALPRIEAAFKKAAAADPHLEEAGPDRALALLYLRAPGWPTGPGDPDLGLEHARRAVELGPDYPPNQIALAEALAATGDAEGGRATYQRALEMARQRAADGDPDAPDWIREAEGALAGKTNGSSSRQGSSSCVVSYPRSFLPVYRSPVPGPGTQPGRPLPRCVRPAWPTPICRRRCRAI